MPAPKYRIAIIQLYPRPMACEDNFLRAAQFIRHAAEAGAHLAVLPEYCLTGWVPSDPRFADAAEDRTYLNRFCGLAQECKICIVPGTMVEKRKEWNKEMLYNVAYFIDDKGIIKGSYTKKNLWHPERDHLESGGHNPHSVIDTPLGKLGLLICWDLAFPEAFRALIVQGAKIIVVPAFWMLNDVTSEGYKRNPNSEEIFLKSTVVSRAYENTACVVFVNAGGRRDRGYAGLSAITMPFMGEIAKAEGTHEQMVIGEVDMEILEEAEAGYRVRYDLTRPDFHYPAKI